ncbi:hypothetical protein H0H87_008299 [Tephrocybe sp. NHM501043]|nr:hypothetical protein H0H87_008299 [Tephrocybe sp. NHM501043]
MDSVSHVRGRGRGNGQAHSRNRHWVAADNGQRSGSSTPYHSDSERWERGGHRGGHRGRGAPRGRSKFSNVSLRVTSAPPPNQVDSLEPDTIFVDENMDEPDDVHVEEQVLEQPEEPVLETAEEREKFYQTLVKAREVERKKAIAEGKMDDPSVAKRLEDAITVVGTCMDMCPRFERYRRERENNLFQWETIPGTKRVDHKRAVKMYERAAGDKTLPSDLRPPPVLKKTLDYLFHKLLPQGGFSATYDFIRDRSRSVRNDFTMQHSYGPEAIECHDRCARFHILALHLGRDNTNFSIPLEEQQLMNTLQSLKEFYEDQRGRYESPTELEMRVYHRLIHIRDQKERHEDIPEHISSHPVFKLTTQFRLHVQKKSAPINKISPLVVDAEGMHIFGELANVLREQGSVVMIYLVACILERLFGKDAIDDIDAIRGELSSSDIIDGISPSADGYHEEEHEELVEDEVNGEDEELILTEEEEGGMSAPPPQPSSNNVFGTLASPFASSTPIFGVSATSVFGKPTPPQMPASTNVPPTNVFGTGSFLPTSTTTSSSPPLTTFPAASTQSAFSLFNATTKPLGMESLKPAAKPTPFDYASESLFGESNISEKSSLPVMNGSASIITQTPPISMLNPTATPFIPQSEAPHTETPIPILETPGGVLFQRSPTPSPSPIPFNSNAPPTPALPKTLSSTAASFPPSSSTAGIPAPLFQRPSTNPPALPKINTNTSSGPSEGPLATPTEPPPLPKPQTISLPPTPTVGPPPKSMLNFLKGSIATPTSSTSNQGMLSPLYMPSPTASGLHEFPFHRKSPTKGSAGQPSSLLLDIHGKGKASANGQVDENMENKSTAFEKKSTIVKFCLRHWHERVVERAAWIEACRQSDAYKQKIKRQQQSSALSDKKRRISAGPGTVVESPIKKRLRRRVSSEYHPPRTDEDLAQRFKEVHPRSLTLTYAPSTPVFELEEYHAHLIFRITKNTNDLRGALPHPSWRVWLSMNPDSDATAIWLERKFDVPTSGDWASETIFSIPLTRMANPDSPGIVVFERTPMEGVTDDLERKYRILDDCTRLRDVVQAFPPKRHFLPSLLIISWIEPVQTKSASDFSEMVDNLVESHLIQGFQTFAITSATKDLDGKLGEALSALSLDVQGKLVRVLNTRGTFKLFEPSFTSFISDWIETCATNNHFNWHMFTQVVQAAISIINSAVCAVGGLLSEQSPRDVLPMFASGPVTDHVSAYDRSIEWLSAIGGSADTIAQDLQAHRNIGHDFPSREFFAGLWDLAQSQAETQMRMDSSMKVYVPITDITSAVEAQDKSYEAHRMLLGRTLHLSIRRSPTVARRRSFTADTETELRLGSLVLLFGVLLMSNRVFFSSSQSKRRRLFSPVDHDSESPEFDDLTPSPYLNGNSNLSPSPSISNTSLPQSDGSAAPGVVTLAMLRALTKDVKKRYSVPSSLAS